MKITIHYSISICTEKRKNKTYLMWILFYFIWTAIFLFGCLIWQHIFFPNIIINVLFIKSRITDV